MACRYVFSEEQIQELEKAAKENKKKDVDKRLRALCLPQCLAEIRRNEESQERYWAREVVWAANQLKIAGVPLVWRRLRELTNMRPQNFRACLPYVGEYADEEMVSQLNDI